MADNILEQKKFKCTNQECTECNQEQLIYKWSDDIDQPKCKYCGRFYMTPVFDEPKKQTFGIVTH